MEPTTQRPTAVQALDAIENAMANATNLQITWKVAQAAFALVRADLSAKTKEIDELRAALKNAKMPKKREQKAQKKPRGG